MAVVVVLSWSRTCPRRPSVDSWGRGGFWAGVRAEIPAVSARVAARRCGGDVRDVPGPAKPVGCHEPFEFIADGCVWVFRRSLWRPGPGDETDRQGRGLGISRRRQEPDLLHRSPVTGDTQERHDPFEGTVGSCCCFTSKRTIVAWRGQGLGRNGAERALGECGRALTCRHFRRPPRPCDEQAAWNGGHVPASRERLRYRLLRPPRGGETQSRGGMAVARGRPLVQYDQGLMLGPVRT